MNLIAYSRVSTDDKGQNPQTQIDAMTHYAQAYGDSIVASFVDEGISGDSVFLERPNGLRIDELLKAHKAQGIIVFAIDRYSRRDPFKVNNELEMLKARGVVLKSVSEPFLNTDSEFRQIVQFMITWFANYFLTQHKKKVCAGLERAKNRGTRSGKAIGRPKLAGWHRNKIIELRTTGLSIRKIATQLNLSVGTVHKTLSNLTEDKDPAKTNSSETTSLLNIKQDSGGTT